MVVNMMGNLEDRLIRATYALSFKEKNSNVNCNDMQQQSMMVELLKQEENTVGMDILDDSFKCEIELNHVKLFPSKVDNCFY